VFERDTQRDTCKDSRPPTTILPRSCTRVDVPVIYYGK